MNKIYEDILNKKASELLNKKLQDYKIEDFMFAFFIQKETKKDIFNGFNWEDNEKTFALCRKLETNDDFIKYNTDSFKLFQKESDIVNEVFYFDSYFLSHCSLNEKELNKKFMEIFKEYCYVVKNDYSFGYFFLNINFKDFKKQVLLDEIKETEEKLEILRVLLI